MLRAKNIARRVLQRIRTPVTVGVRNAIDVRGKWLEPGLVRMRLARQRHGQHGAPVKGVLETDDRRPVRVAPRDFHRILDRLRPAVYQHRFLRKVSGDQRVQFFRQLDVLRVRRHAEARVQKCVQLFPNRGHHARRPVPCVHNSNAACKIEEAVSVHVLDHRPFGSRRENRSRMRDASRHGRLPPPHPLLRFRSGNWCAQLDCRHVSTIRSAVRSN